MMWFVRQEFLWGSAQFEGFKIIPPLSAAEISGRPLSIRLHPPNGGKRVPRGSNVAGEVPGSFSMREKGGNRLVSGSDYMVDALKLPNHAPKVSGESLPTCVARRCPKGTQHFCWPILAVSGQSLASNGPVVGCTDLDLVFGHTEATHNSAT
ncbi:hypothetical protein TNCV_221191 [Trichonephila clavipes]|nr:hypothetical protein TNCV_221191 [Trichonephila clavipes]